MSSIKPSRPDPPRVKNSKTEVNECRKPTEMILRLWQRNLYTKLRKTLNRRQSLCQTLYPPRTESRTFYLQTPISHLLLLKNVHSRNQSPKKSHCILIDIWNS